MGPAFVCVVWDGSAPSVQKVFVFKRTGAAVNMVAGRDLNMEELMLTQRPYCPAEVRHVASPWCIDLGWPLRLMPPSP